MNGKWLVTISVGVIGIAGAGTAYLLSDEYRERGNVVTPSDRPGGDRGCGDSKADEGCGYDKP